MIRRAIILNDSDMIDLSMLNFEDETAGTQVPIVPAYSDTSPTSITPLWRQEQDIIDNAIAAFNGNIAKAARALEISPSTIYRKMEHWRTKAA